MEMKMKEQILIKESKSKKPLLKFQKLILRFIGNILIV
jgi:hypothetical protein